MARDRRLAVLKVFKQQPDIVTPEDWFSASIEIVLITASLAWVIQLIFNREFFDDNVVLQRRGYHSFGVAMLFAPALYPCAVIFSVAMYCHLRYCYVDYVRCKLSDATSSQKHWTAIANMADAFSWMAFPLIFVHTPDKNALISFCTFTWLVVCNFFGLVMNFHEVDIRYHKKGSWVYLALLAFFTIAFPTSVLVQIGSYNEETKELGPVPIWLCAVLDYGWYVMLVLQSRFMPAAPSLHYECELVEDEDFKCDKFRKSDSIDAIRATDKPHPISLVEICKEGEVQSPEVWFGASSETMTICFIVSWTISAIFNRELITDNHLMQRLGYNNICVAWDAPPALYPASIIFSLSLYCQLRFCYLDNLRSVLSSVDRAKKRATKIANLLQGGSWCVFPLVYVITPDQNALVHSSAFVCLIFGNLVGMMTNFYEMDNQYHKKGSWIYLACLTFFAIGFPTVVVIQLLTYNEETEELGPVPVPLNVVLDYGWFICLAVQGRFMPAAPSIRFKTKLVEDADFKFYAAKIEPTEAEETGRCNRDSSTIICPILATLYNQGDLEVDENGCCTQEQLKKALMKTGCSGSLLSVLSLPAKNKPLNIFEMTQNKSVAHKISSCIRNPQPDEGALYKFFDDYVTKRDVITTKELGMAWSGMTSDPEAKGNSEGMPLMIAVFATMIEAFGRAENGRCYLTKDDLHDLYIGMKYPAHWQPHKYGFFDVVKRTRAIQKKRIS